MRKETCLYKSVLEYQPHPVTLWCQSHFSFFQFLHQLKELKKVLFSVSSVQWTLWKGLWAATHQPLFKTPSNWQFSEQFGLKQDTAIPNRQEEPMSSYLSQAGEDSVSDSRALYVNQQWFVGVWAVQSEYNSMWPLENGNNCLTSTTPCSVRRPLS